MLYNNPHCAPFFSKGVGTRYPKITVSPKSRGTYEEPGCTYYRKKVGGSGGLPRRGSGGRAPGKRWRPSRSKNEIPLGKRTFFAAIRACPSFSFCSQVHLKSAKRNAGSWGPADPNLTAPWPYRRSNSTCTPTGRGLIFGAKWTNS